MTAPVTLGTQAIGAAGELELPLESGGFLYVAGRPGVILA